MKKVKWKGKWYLFDEAKNRLLELGTDDKETGVVVTDFAKEELESSTGKTYDEAYVKQLRDEAAALRQQVNRFKDAAGDLTPEQVKELRAREAELARKEEDAAEAKAKAEGRYQEVIDKKLESFNRERDQLVRERDSAREELRNYKISTELLRAAQRPESVNPEQVAQLLRGYIAIDENGQLVVLDEDRKTPRIGKKDARQLVGAEGVKAFVDEFYEASPWFLRGHSGGAGSGGAGGGAGGPMNPWKKETFNLTEQSRITRENPELAGRMRAAAGA